MMSNKPESLKTRLDAYSTVSNNVSRRRWTRWEVYAAAGGAALAMTTGATASIIWSGLQNLTLSVPELGAEFNNNPAVLNIDIDGPGLAGNVFGLDMRNFRATDVQRWGTTTTTSTTTTTTTFGSSGTPYYNPHYNPNTHYTYTHTSTYTSRRVRARLQAPALGAFVGSGVPYKLSSGNAISSGQSFTGSGLLRAKSSTSFGGGSDTGYFPMSGPGIVGVRFQQGGQNHYGWIRFSFEDTNHDGWLDKITATDWAYENVADGSILAGQTTGGIPSVPEPGTMSLSVLALGSAGVLALRRRRKVQAEENAASQES